MKLKNVVFGFGVAWFVTVVWFFFWTLFMGGAAGGSHELERVFDVVALLGAPAVFLGCFWKYSR
jgi:hypothetical protein